MNKKKKEPLTPYSIIMIVLALTCFTLLFLKGAKISDKLILNLNYEKFGSLIDQVNNGKSVRV